MGTLNRYLVKLRTASDGLGRLRVCIPVESTDDATAAGKAKEKQARTSLEMAARRWVTESVQLIN